MSNKFKFHFSKQTYIVFGIFLLALSLRLIYVFQLKSSPLFGYFSTDSSQYDSFALTILRGMHLSKEVFFMHPLYPYFLANIYRVFGHSHLAVVICQAIIDSMSCILIYRICVKTFQKGSIGLFASLVYAFYSMAIFYTGFLLDTTLLTFFCLGLILLLLEARERDSQRLWFLSGITLGLIFLLKAYIIVFFWAIVFWRMTDFWDHKDVRNKMLSVVLIGFGILAAVFPFSWRNYILQKQISPVPASGGIIFYMGNNPRSVGVPNWINVPKTPIGEKKGYRYYAELETNKNLSYAQASNYWFEKGLKFIKDNPRQFISLTALKIFLFWNKVNIPLNLNFYFVQKTIPFLQIPLFSFGFIAPFALVGAILVGRKKFVPGRLILLFLLFMMVTIIVAVVTTRYRFPCIPYLIILAAFACSYSWDNIRNFKGRELLKVFLLACLFSFFVWHDIPFLNYADEESEIQSYINIAGNYFSHDKGEEAIKVLEKTHQDYPRNPLVAFMLALGYFQQGREDQAESMFNRVLELQPQHSGARYKLAVIYQLRGELDRAKEIYLSVLEKHPHHPGSYFHLGLIYYNEKDFEEAAQMFQKVIEIDPEKVEAYQYLGNIYAELDQEEEALKVFQKAFEVDPQKALDVLVRLGEMYQAEEDISKAKGIYEKVLEINPEHSLAHYSLALLYLKEGSSDLAAQYYDRAVSLGMERIPEVEEEIRNLTKNR